MMGQELFENPQRQYAHFGLVELPSLAEVLGVPDDNGELPELSEEQLGDVDHALADFPDYALTFDEAGRSWIAGPEEKVEAMFAAREEFLAALDNDIDPGV
ncbi:molecular chaperone GrpE [Corynebacterium sp.]|uniref:molecular chaperone GrpE n=1 Tax=Corynebacterium sp. TaxID=1720 RepID=UPI0026DABA3C|nr:molecular chaperone GrpE [Corynebacterium sp.]MDO5031973.1 molecular chaperone GrpE [Corynebacterium sp.]